MGTTVEDYEDFRPCFFESGAEDEFYDAPAPSEDIWKKFELLPTPPRSPKHETCYSTLAPASTLDKLRLVSEILDDPICKTVVFPEGFSAKCMDTCCNFNSKLIHDCMWSGNNIPEELKIGHNIDPKRRSRSCSISSNSDVTASSLCVDPNSTAVFPYPVSGSNINNKVPPIKVKPTSLGTETPSESEPESEDDEEEEEEDDDEDEEIDVVTVASTEKVQVENTRYSRVRPVLPATPTTAASAQVAAMHNYTAAAPKSPKSDSSNDSSSAGNNSSSNSSRSSSHGQKRHRSHHHDHSTPLKRTKFTVSQSSSELRSVMNRYKHQHCRTPSTTSNSSTTNTSSSNTNHNRCSSDSEDSDCKRAQHNVLERKRRNDLKSSFHRLRDHVPDLQSQERAAKVTILKKATDHIMYLRRQHQTLNVELDRQQRTHEALQRRLRLLRSK